MHTFEYILILLAAVLVSSYLGARFPKLPTSLVQIALGVALTILPVSLEQTFEPELFMVLFIAPLLFEDAKKMDKAALWRLRSPVLWLALGLVFSTVLVLGFAVNLIEPSIPLAAAFALAAALAPTDAVSVGSLKESAKISDDQSQLLQGESLLNDASSIVSFNFAVAAMLTGSFSLLEAEGVFLIEFFGALALGVVLMLLRAAFLRFLRAQDVSNASFHVLFEVVTPLLVYLLAEFIGVSGIIAVVAAGITHSFGPRVTTPSSARLSIVSTSVWSVISFTLNGLVFLMLGTQLPYVIMRVWGSSAANTNYLLILIVFILFVILALRFVWVLAMHRNVDLGQDSGGPGPEGQGRAPVPETQDGRCVPEEQGKVLEIEAQSGESELETQGRMPGSGAQPSSSIEVMTEDDLSKLGYSSAEMDEAGLAPELERKASIRREPSKEARLNGEFEVCSDVPDEARAKQRSDAHSGTHGEVRFEQQDKTRPSVQPEQQAGVEALLLGQAESRFGQRGKSHPIAQPEPRHETRSDKRTARQAARKAKKQAAHADKQYWKHHLYDALLLSLTGVKGAITLAIMLSLPLNLGGTVPFPERDLLIFLSSGVILLSLLTAYIVVPLIAPKKREAPPPSSELKATIAIYRKVIAGLAEITDDNNRTAVDAMLVQYNNRINTLKSNNSLTLPDEARVRRYSAELQIENTRRLTDEGRAGGLTALIYINSQSRQLARSEHHSMLLWELRALALQLTHSLFGGWSGPGKRRGGQASSEKREEQDKRPSRVGQPSQGGQTKRDGRRPRGRQERRYSLLEMYLVNYRYAIGMLNDPENTKDLPEHTVRVVVTELEQRLTRMENHISSAVVGGGMQAVEGAMVKVEAQALDLERRAINEALENGRISNETAKVLRDNVAMMELDMEDLLE